MKEIFTPFGKWFACLYGLLLLAIFLPFAASAQSPSRFTSGNFANPNNWAQASSVAMSGSSGGSFLHNTTANGTGDQFFRLYSATSGGTTYEPNGASDILLNPNTTTNLQVTGSGKAYFVNVSSTSDRYIFKTIGSGTPGTSRLVIFRVQGTERNVAASADVTRSPSGTVYPGQPVTVSAVASGVLPTGQRMYIRYTTDNFTTSTIAAMSFVSGTTYAATIPSATNAAAATLRYYVLTSGGNTDGSALTISHADADFYTINAQINGGSNYTYTVANSWVTNAATAWNTASTWVGGVVPTDGFPISISHNISLDISTRSVPALTLADGVTLTLGANTLTLNSAGNGTTLTGGGTTGSTITTTGAGKLATAGAGTQTFTGRLTLDNVNIATAVNFGTTATIASSRALTLATGGSVSTNAPTYTAGSTLEYAQSGTATRGTEWNAASGQGYPSNVLLTATNLNMGTGVTDINCGGTVSIPTGTALSMQTGSGALNIGGLSLSGTLTQSSNASSSVRCTGNLTFNTGSTYTANGRTLTLNGSANANLAGLSTLVIHTLEINKTGGATVTLANARTITGGGLTLTQGVFATSTNLTLSSGAFINIGLGSLTGTPNFTGNHALTYLSGFSGTTSIELPTDANIGGIAVNSGATLSINRSIVMPTTKAFTVAGTLNLASNTITGAGSFSLGATGVVNVTNASGIDAVIAPTTVSATSGAIVNLLASGNLSTGAISWPELLVVIKTGITTAIAQTVTIGQLTLEGTTTVNHTAGILTLSSTGAVNVIANGGTLTTSATMVVSGTGTKTIVGSTAFSGLTLNSSLSLPTNCSIAGALVINVNGAIVGNAPTYGASSSLTYQIGSGYNRTLEWSATSGAGYPVNVTVSAGTTLNLLGSGSALRQISGLLTINGGNLNMGTMADRLVCLNGVIISSGTLTLGSNSGGDLEIRGGDLTLNTGAVFTDNGREISFTGTTNQAVVGGIAGTFSIPLVGYSGSANLNINRLIAITTRLRLSGGSVVPNSNLTIGSGATILRQAGALSTAPVFGGPITISYNNTQNLTTDNELPTSAADISVLNINSTSFTTTLNRNLVINSGRIVNVNSGVFILGGQTITGAGTYNANGGIVRLAHVGGIASAIGTTTRNFSSGIIDFNAGSTQSFGVVAGLTNMRIATIGAGTNLTLNAATTIRGLYVATSTGFDLAGQTLTISIATTDTTIYGLGTFAHNNGKIIFAGSSSAIHILKGTLDLKDVDVIPSGLVGINFGTATTVYGTLSMHAGSFCTTRAPSYADASTLNYRSGGPYNISVEWSNPYNVQASFATLVNVGGSVPSVLRTLRGNLIVDQNSTISMNETGSKMTAALRVGGNLQLSGTLILSDQVGGDVTIGGDFYVNTGFAFSGNSRAVTFDGSGDQLLDGTSASPIFFQFFTVNKPSGTFTISHQFILDNGNGTAQLRQISGTTNLNNQAITLAGSGTRILRVDAGTMYTGGTPLNVTGLVFQDASATNGRLSGTIVFNRTGTENVPALTYNNLDMAGSNVKTLLGNTIVNAQLSMIGGATLNDGGFTFGYGASGSLYYAGNLDQTAGIEWPAVNGPSSVEINNPVFVILGASRTINGTLTMRSGDLVIGENILSVGTSSVSIGSVVLPNGSTGGVVGKLRRWLSTSAATYQFPIGVPSARRNAEVTFTSGPSVGGTITAQLIAGRPTETGLPLTQSGIVANNLGTNGIWELETGDGFSGGTYGITLTGTSFLGVNNFNRLVMVKRASSGNPWLLLGTHVATSGTNNTPIAGRTGLTSFSQFGIGGNFAENPLPVTLTYFGGKRIGNADHLSWITTEEIDNEGFILASSSDGLVYEVIQSIPSVNNGKGTVRYAAISELDNPAQATYYRLQQRDLNGMISGTWYAIIQPTGAKLEMGIWPNPVTAGTQIVLPFKANEPCSLSLYDATGRVLHAYEATPSQVSDDMVRVIIGLPAGTYWLRASNLQMVLPVVKVAR